MIAALPDKIINSKRIMELKKRNKQRMRQERQVLIEDVEKMESDLQKLEEIERKRSQLIVAIKQDMQKIRKDAKI